MSREVTVRFETTSNTTALTLAAWLYSTHILWRVTAYSLWYWYWYWYGCASCAAGWGVVG